MSHVIAHKGLDYHLSIAIDSDGRTVIDMDLDYATWRSRPEAAEVVADMFEIGLGAAFWPRVVPTEGAKVDDGLAAVLFAGYEREILAALEREITDTAIAVEGATR